MKPKFIIDDRALETGLVLWVEYEDNGVPEYVYRVQFVGKFFGDYWARVKMGDGVEAALGDEVFYEEPDDEKCDVAFKAQAVDCNRPLLDLYLEFNQIEHNDRDNRE
ncbi:hypothetical protein BDV06DRAFT_225691 [Aspergillus oleicola]